MRKVRIESSHIERGFKLSKLELAIPELPQGLLGCKIVQLSDLHFGAATSSKHIEKCIELTNSTEPDVVVLTGDLIQITRHGAEDKLARLFDWKRGDWLDHKRQVRERAQILGELLLKIDCRRRLAVPGNHDHREGLRIIQKHLGPSIEWLINGNIHPISGERKLVIAGVDDFRRGKINLGAASEGIESECVRILLSHNPDVTVVDDYEKLEMFDLILCGHTHGGQIKIPGLRFSRTEQKIHFSGLTYHNNTAVYVSNGVGYQGIPFRFNAPPEIVVCELKQS